MTAADRFLSFDLAQHDMRSAYASGATGVLASALAWAVAAVVARMSGEGAAVLALLGCGVLIHPVSLVLTRLVGRSARPRAGNALGSLALESVAVLLVGCVLAWALSTFRVALFFPAMLLVIAGRYTLFQTMYGLRVYWALAAVLGLAAFGVLAMRTPAWTSALAGAAIEAVFAVMILRAALAESPATRAAAPISG